MYIVNSYIYCLPLRGSVSRYGKPKLGLWNCGLRL
jgi:hypothetical protein